MTKGIKNHKQLLLAAPVALFVISLALYLRLYDLNNWLHSHDEIRHYYAVTDIFYENFLYFVSADFGFRGFNLFFYPLRFLFSGAHEFRIILAGFSILTAIFTFIFIKKFSGSTVIAGSLSLAIFFSPYIVVLSELIRPYLFLIFLIFLALYLLNYKDDLPRKLFLPLYFICHFLLLTSHVTGIFVTFAIVSVTLFYHNKDKAYRLLSLILLILGTSKVIFILRHLFVRFTGDVANYQKLGYVRSKESDLLDYPSQLFFGFDDTATSIAIIALVLLGLFRLFHYNRPTFYVTLLIVVVQTILSVFSLLPLGSMRQTLYLLPFILVCLAAAFRTKRKALSIAPLIILVPLCIGYLKIHEAKHHIANDLRLSYAFEFPRGVISDLHAIVDRLENARSLPPIYYNTYNHKYIKPEIDLALEERFEALRKTRPMETVYNIHGVIYGDTIREQKKPGVYITYTPRDTERFTRNLNRHAFHMLETFEYMSIIYVCPRMYFGGHRKNKFCRKMFDKNKSVVNLRN